MRQKRQHYHYLHHSNHPLIRNWSALLRIQRLVRVALLGARDRLAMPTRAKNMQLRAPREQQSSCSLPLQLAWRWFPCSANLWLLKGSNHLPLLCSTQLLILPILHPHPTPTNPQLEPTHHQTNYPPPTTYLHCNHLHTPILQLH